jgi:hypothetical protein
MPSQPNLPNNVWKTPKYTSTCEKKSPQGACLDTLHDPQRNSGFQSNESEYCADAGCNRSTLYKNETPKIKNLFCIL